MPNRGFFIQQTHFEIHFSGKGRRQLTGIQCVWSKGLNTGYILLSWDHRFPNRPEFITDVDVEAKTVARVRQKDHVVQKPERLGPQK